MSAKRKNALGRGLGALLNDTTAVPGTELIRTREERFGISEILISEIEANPFQPRSDFDKTALQELANSIKTQGIIQPITVRKLADKKYQLITGERRLQASKIVKLKALPAYVRTANDQQMLEMAIIENIQSPPSEPVERVWRHERWWY